MNLEEFQALHGEAFAHILNNPAFSAGMIHLTIATTNRLKNLTDQEIRDNAAVILSDLRGRLRHEAELIALAVPPEPNGLGDPMEDYPDGIEEHFKETQRNKPVPTT